jgi:hypothetical protein
MVNKPKGTYYLDLSDRILLAQEGINVLDEHLDELMHELVDDGEDMTERETQNRLIALQIDVYADMIKRYTLEDEEPADMLAMLMVLDEQGEEYA